MKNRVLPQSFVTAATLLAAFIICAPLVPAADKPAPAAADSEPAGYALEIENGKLVRNSGDGRNREATLDNVLDVLRDNYTHANIVMAPGLAKVKIADLKLRALQLPEELEAVRVASGYKFEWHGPGDNLVAGGVQLGSESAAVNPATGLPVSPGEAASQFNAGLFVLREPVPTTENSRMVEVFNLSPYLERLHKNDSDVATHLNQIEGIIGETLKGLDQGDSAHSPTYQFHSGANLLVVIGTKEEIDVTRKVVRALLGEPDFEGAQPGGIYTSGNFDPRNQAMFDFKKRSEALKQQSDAFQKAIEAGRSTGKSDPFSSATPAGQTPAPGARP